MPAAAILSLLVELLAGATGKSEAHWRNVLGEIEVRPLAMNVRGNWFVGPTGSADDVEAAEKAIDLVRREHPYAL